jgi:AcrR family transcriptional regulator
MQRTRRTVDERRAELVDATLGILASEGLGAATTRRITEEAGLALGAFHYAFRSKDELLRAVIERLMAQI